MVHPNYATATTNLHLTIGFSAQRLFNSLTTKKLPPQYLLRELRVGAQLTGAFSLLKGHLVGGVNQYRLDLREQVQQEGPIRIAATTICHNVCHAAWEGLLA
jgi:hypothetical protein